MSRARGKVRTKNGANGMSDIEGKAARAGASKPGGERVSIKKVEGSFKLDENIGRRCRDILIKADQHSASQTRPTLHRRMIA